MSPSKFSFKKVEHSKYGIYLAKAKDFFHAMMRSYGKSNQYSVSQIIDILHERF